MTNAEIVDAICKQGYEDAGDTVSIENYRYLPLNEMEKSRAWHYDQRIEATTVCGVVNLLWKTLDLLRKEKIDIETVAQNIHSIAIFLDSDILELFSLAAFRDGDKTGDPKYFEADLLEQLAYGSHEIVERR